MSSPGPLNHSSFLPQKHFLVKIYYTLALVQHFDHFGSPPSQFIAMEPSNSSHLSIDNLKSPANSIGSTLELTAQSEKDPQDVESASDVQVDTDSRLPRADGGKEAWLFLAGCFVFEALVWGISYHL